MGVMPLQARGRNCDRCFLASWVSSDIISTKGSAFPRIIIRVNILPRDSLGGLPEMNVCMGLDISARFRP